MVEYNSHTLDATFAALADPTRRAIIAQLAAQELSVGEIAEPYDMSLAAVSKHLHVLDRAELISVRKEGRVRRCSLNPQALRRVADWVDYYRSFWEGSFDALGDYLDTLESGKSPTKRSRTSKGRKP